MIEGEYFTSKTAITTVEEETEVIVKERKITEEEVWRTPEISPPQTVTERDDDWFVLLDVISRGTPYVPPGTPQTPCTTFQISCFTLCFLTICSKCMLLHVLKDFLLTLLTSVTLKERDALDTKSFVSVAQTAPDEEIREVVAEEKKIIQEAPRLLKEIPQQPVTDRDDDWFLLLDVVPRETSYVPPGIAKIPPLLRSFIKASNYYELCRCSYP